MINELKEFISAIEKLNIISGVQLVTKDEINEAIENLNEYNEDIIKLKEALQELNKFYEKMSKLRNKLVHASPDKYETVEQAIADFTHYFGDIIQDLQNIEELTGIAARRYVKHRKL